MLDINTHPIWKSINPLKKRGHLLRLSLAKKYVGFIDNSKFIAVVGAVGKTTTIVACQKVLAEKFNTISTLENGTGKVNLDPIFSLPITILKVRPSTQKVLLELGIEYPGEMELYGSIVSPQTIIVTKLSYEHNEFLGSLEKVIEEEGKLIEKLNEKGTVILNWDDLPSRKLSEKTKAEVIFYGTDKKNCHLWAGNIKIEDFKTVFELNYGVERVEIRSQLLGMHQVTALLAAAALGVRNGLSLTTIKKGLEKVTPAPHRMQVLSGFNGSIVLDDTYNAQPAAVEEAIDTLNFTRARRRIVVLSEMKELGEYSEKLHRVVARKIYNDKIDLVLLGTGNTKFIHDELEKLGFISERIESGLTNQQLVSKLLKIIARGDVVLVKGANSARLDEVVKKITK